jgi:O-antigen ligase
MFLFKKKYFYNLLFLLSIVVSDARFRVRALDNMSIDWLVLLKIIIWGLVSFYGYVFLIQNILEAKKYIKNKKVNIYLFFWLLFFLLSVIISIDPLFSLASSLLILGHFFYILFLILRYGSKNLLKVLFYSLFISILFCWLYYLFVPDIGRFYEYSSGITRFAGIYSPNQVGIIAVILLLFLYKLNSIVEFKKSTKLLLTVFLIVSLSLTYSRGAIVTLLFVILVIKFNDFKSDRNKKIVLSSLFVVGLLLIPFLGDIFNIIVKTLSRSGNAEEIYMLTGRAYLWLAVFKEILNNLFLGHGYGTTRFLIAQVTGSGEWQTSHMHNILIESLTMVGILGTIPFVLLVFEFIKDVFVHSTKKITYIVIAILIYGLTSSIFVSEPSLLNLVLMSVILSYGLSNTDIRLYTLRVKSINNSV